MQYRTHDGGPLTTIRVEKGRIVVTMDFDLPGSFTRLHSHPFDHWMECVSGLARIAIDDAETIVRPGDRYLVEAHKRHGVWPLMSGTVLRCVHEHADIDPAHPDAAHGIPLEWLDRLTDHVGV
jgi:quercetin dioxygenase-like cupin family protein